MDTDSLRIEKILDLQKVNTSNLKGINHSLKESNNLTEKIIQNVESFQFDQKEAVERQTEQLKGLKTEIEVINSNLEKLSDNKLFNKIGYDTVFTVSATLFIFMLGISIDRIFKLISSTKKRNKIKKYFCNNVKKFSDNLLAPMKKAYKDFYLQHDINTGIPLTPPRILTSEVARIADLDFKDIMESFKYDENIYKTLQYVEFTDGLLDDVESYHEIVLTKSNNQRNNLQKMLEEYISLLANFLEEEKGRNDEYKTFDLWILINDMVLYFHETAAEQNRLSIIYYKILRPIQVFLVQKNYFRTHEQAGVIAESGRLISARFYELRYLTTEIRLEYRKFYFSLVSISGKIDNMIEKFTKNNWL